MNFIINLLATINMQVNHYTFDVYHAIVATLSTTLTILLVVYFAGLGWLVIRGLIPLTPLAIAWHMLKVSFAFTFALHWDYFSYFIVDFFLHGTDRLLGTMLNGTGYNSDTNTITYGIAHIWQTGSNVFADVWRTSGANFLLGTLMGFLGYGIVMGITAVSLFYIIMAKIALSVLLVLTPLMLPLYLWEFSREIFNGWLRLLIKWMLMPLFIYTFVGLYLNLLQGQINTMANAANGPTTASISAFVLLGIIAIATFKQAGNMTSEIARGVAVQDKGAHHWLNIPKTVYKSWQSQG